MRTFFIVMAALPGSVLSAWAQQSEPSPASVERIRAALQNPPPPLEITGVTTFGPARPDEFHWGVLTFVPPDTPGQFVGIRVPIGGLISQAAHSIAAAQHRRAERAAHLEVVNALAEFQRDQQK